MEIELTCPQKFEVRQPRWLLVLSIILLVLFVGIASFIIEQTCEGVYNIEQAVSMIIPLAVATLFLGTLGIYSYCHDTFKYKDGEFVCKRALRKTKKWKIDDVSKVVLMKHNAYSFVYVLVFLDKNNKILARVTDGKWVWEDDNLRRLLFHYNIPTEDKYAFK